MWENILNILIAAINACFGWFDRLMQAIPGAWDTIFTLITIIVISRFLLAPLVGWTFTVGSDTVQGYKNKAEFNRRTRESYNEMKFKKGKFEGL